MNHEQINWDKVPDVITKEQLQQICYISKSTARFLLLSGKIPCMYNGKRTRCYKILKKDVMDYLSNREKCPEYYLASNGWYANKSEDHFPLSFLPSIKENLYEYYTYILRKYPDVLNSKEISKLTGYNKTTINHWCKTENLRHLLIKGRNIVPKTYLIDFFCSNYFRAITRKSEWHIKILMEYPKWKYGKKTR